MDPSSNNHQLYTPAQQNTPSQQGYPPANAYQYTQQPQNAYLISNTNNNLNQLDQGCFKAYKIILFIEFVWHLYGAGSLLRLAIAEGYWNFSFVISWALSFSFMALILIQFSAIKDRNLHKAKMAFLGFIGYFSILFVYQLQFFLRLWTILDSGFIVQSCFLNFLDIVLVFIGSFKVYQLLNVNQIKSEADSYSSYYKA